MSKYFTEPKKINSTDFEAALNVVSCEDGVKYVVSNEQKLISQLSILNGIGFVNLNNLAKPIRTIKPNNLEQRDEAVTVNSDARFNVHTINFELGCDGPMEMLAAANLYPMLMARLNREVMRCGYYKSCDVIDDYDDGTMGVMMAADIVAPAGADASRMRSLAKNATHEFPSEADVTRYNKRPYKLSGSAYDYLSVGVLAPYDELKKYLNYDELRRTWLKIKLGDIVKSSDDRPRRQMPLR